jgi:hypothetical protein
MQLSTNLATVVFAAGSVLAVATHEPLESRAPGDVLVQFYSQGGCQGSIVHSVTYHDDGTDKCSRETFTGPYGSYKVETNEARRPRKPRNKAKSLFNRY